MSISIDTNYKFKWQYNFDHVGLIDFLFSSYTANFIKLNIKKYYV